ncbi:MAG: KAP family NTPase [Thermoanaerobaculia bacterium]|nr:KAP family NTPase [Thermoanaerobaculia bacterium]
MPAIGFLDDDPISSAEALTGGHRRLAEQLLTLLLDGVSGPILVTGDWGSGKTSVLKAVQRGFDAPPVSPRTAFFEAWHYESGAGLFPALLRSLWSATRSGAKEPPDPALASKWHTLWRCGLIAASKTAHVAASAFGLGPLAEVLKGLDLDKIARELRALDDAAEKPPSDPIADLRENFAAFIEAAWPGTPSPVVFIDDLDRCSPAGAVSLLESIRLLVTGCGDLGCRFVVALDRDILIQAVSKKFEGIPGFDGNRYLEKVFPLEFQVPLPTPAEAQELVKRLLEKAPTPRARNVFSTVFSDPSFANPRLIKRSINKFNLLLSLEHEPKDEIADRVAARWIVATGRWPSLRRLLQRRDDAYWAALKDHLASPSPQGVDPETKALLDEPGARGWLTNAGLLDSTQSYRTADNRLRQFGL